MKEQKSIDEPTAVLLDQKSDSIQKSKEEVLDLVVILKTIWKYRKLYYIVLPIVFLLSCLYILTVPRYYKSGISLAPEMEQQSGISNLSSIASSFGFNLSDIQSTDAITPLLYPDLMRDNKFITDMFSIQVRTSLDTINTDYYTYVTKYKKHSLIKKVIGGIKNLFSSEEQVSMVKSSRFDPYHLTRFDEGVVNSIRDDIKLSVDKKTGVISLTTTSQDPLVSKILADSVTSFLQKFIIKYRTSKAQKEADHYKKLMNDALSDYEKVRQKYAAYSDANTDIILESVKLKMEDLENDMQLKYNKYTTFNTQYQAAIAKVMERTPAFTLLKGAEVPAKPSGPKRMLFVGLMTVLAFIFTSLYAYFIKK